MKINRFRGDGIGHNRVGTRFPYLAGPELVEAVNMAIYLGRPLLVKGPPGCGKTKLAAAVAHELGLPLHEWYVKSTSHARDGLYTIDVVRRLLDAQLQRETAQRITPYLRFGPLGHALRGRGESVVLIDEIDNADIDFPNDLLRELDDRRFTVEEVDEGDLTPMERQNGFARTYGGEAAPIVVITSNDDKELPDAFLRRCIFHWIDFPDASRLQEIVKVHLGGENLDDIFVRRCVERLEDLRRIEGLRKKPATSELVDWVRILLAWGVNLSSVLDDRSLAELPHWRMLFKHHDDRSRVERAFTGGPTP